ncbi:MAG: ABC transporter ATP-binding protein [Clostridia bacterium]|nr:ABC transporter ATP-binding protein [Clostridia bacterium]
MNKKHHTDVTLHWISKVFGKSKWLVVCLVVLQSLLSLSGIFYTLILRWIINAAVDGNQNEFFISIAVLVGVICFQILIQAVNRFLNEYTDAVAENKFKSRLFSSLLTGNYSSVTATHSGEWMNRLTSDTVVVAGGVTQIIPGLIGMSVRMIGAIVAIVWLIPEFLYIFVPGGIAMFLLTYAFRKVLKRLHKQIQEADGTMRVFLQERLENLLIVRAFNKEKQTVNQADVFMENHKNARLKRNRFSNICNIGFSSLMNGAYIIGIIYCGYGILTGTMSYGNLMAIMQLIGQVQNPFANITGYLPKYYSMLASAERLMEVERFEKDSENRMTQAQITDFYKTDFEAIYLEQANFTYQPPVQTDEEQSPMPVVLKDVNLEIKKGEYIVFTGPSGCGKSTVLKLLMCLYPLDSGERFLKTIHGKQPLTSSWRSLFTYVPQGNQLLSGTIREIIAFGDKEKAQDDVAIHRALTIACAEEFVTSLDNGLDTVLGERGLGLSEGQMQRIAIARAIFSDNPILMLDEATSALDESTACQLLANLRSMTDKTVILVTHRMVQAGIFDKELSFSKDGIQKKEWKEKSDEKIVRNCNYCFSCSFDGCDDDNGQTGTGQTGNTHTETSKESSPI